MVSWKGVFVIFATVLIASSSCDSDCEGEQALKDINVEWCSYYYDLLENALLNDSDNVYRLQQTFFPQRGDPPNAVDISVSISVGEIVRSGSCDELCSRPSFNKTGESYTLLDKLEWRNPHDIVQVEDMLPANTLMMKTFESIFYFSGSVTIGNGCNSVAFEIQLDLQLDQLPCNPCSHITHSTLAYIIAWVRIS